MFYFLLTRISPPQKTILTQRTSLIAHFRDVENTADYSLHFALLHADTSLLRRRISLFSIFGYYIASPHTRRHHFVIAADHSIGLSCSAEISCHYRRHFALSITN
jgi:hypothetical protein